MVLHAHIYYLYIITILLYNTAHITFYKTTNYKGFLSQNEMKPSHFETSESHFETNQSQNETKKGKSHNET